MKSQKDMTSLFREAEKKLSIQPSSSAWEQLERRLDKGQKNAGIFRMRWIAVAASVILVVGSLYLWQSNDGNLREEGNYMPTLVEVLPGTSDCNPYCLVLQGRKELPDYYATPVRPTVN